MANETLGNSQAFPYDYEFPKATNLDTGLTKREYFAAIALQGMLASGSFANFEELTINSVECADALIDALNK